MASANAPTNSSTDIDLKIGINAEIGSIPLALEAEVEKKGNDTIYTFNGSVQNADIDLKSFFTKIGEQFEVDVQFPPELKLDLMIEYLVGQVKVTKPSKGNQTTDLGVSGSFQLKTEKHTIAWQFFAASKLTKGAPTQDTKPYVVGFALETELEFKKLPVLGKVPGFNDLVLKKIGFSYTNDKSTKGVDFVIPTVSSSPNPLYTRQDPSAKNKTEYAIQSEGADKKFKLSNGGFSLTVGLENSSTGKVANSFALPMDLAPKPPDPKANPYAPGKTSPPKSPIHWIELNKKFGPIDLRKIGLNYSKGEATFGFSAGFTLAFFTLDVEGLAITFPMPLPGQSAGDKVSFDLQGLGIDFKKGGLAIGGGFIKTVDEDGIINFYGELVIKAASFGFTALGGYSPNAKPPSFFIYVNLDIPLGGPPFFFVTGLAGGFGINRTLNLPTIDTLPYFPLLPQNAPPAGATPKDTLASALPALAQIFENKPGQYWVAVGVQFTSFEMIEAFALVTISFGVDFQLAVLGVCSMSLPTPKADGVPPIAYIEIDIIAELNPALGLFSVDGRLSPASFIFEGLCKIAGGFAFYVWYGEQHHGDFVVTIGGYHPAFKKPDHYPTVPRLTMSYGLGPFQIGGKAYFALTPSVIMAGIEIYATWNSGPIKAWFDAGVNFLLGWAPFHYLANAFIHVGISADLGLFTVSLHVGVDLDIWGPKFGGKAVIDLDIVSFTIHFGAEQASPPPVGWQTFKDNFLPKETKGANPTPLQSARLFAAAEAVGAPPERINIISASVSKGLLQKNVEDYDWIIDPNHFVILTNSTIPANLAEWNPNDGAGNKIEIPIDKKDKENNDNYNKEGAIPFLQLGPKQKTFSDTQVWNPTVNIGPMKQHDIKSHHQVTLHKVEGTGSGTPIKDFTVQPVLLSSPKALWGPYRDASDQNPNPKGGQLLEYALVGFEISPIPRHPNILSSLPLIELLFNPGKLTQFSYTAPAVNKDYTVKSTLSDNDKTLTIDVTGTDAPAPMVNNDYVLSALADQFAANKRGTILKDLKADGFLTYTADEVDVHVLASETALVDWPMVELLGAD